MSLNNKIIACDQCSLYKYMDISPIPPQVFGTQKPESMWIIGSNMNLTNDLEQLVLTGINLKLFIKELYKYEIRNFYLTPLVKCRPKDSKTFTTNQINTCTSWLDKEKNEISPKYIIGCGAQCKKYIDLDFELPAINNLLAGKKGLNRLREVLEQIQ